MLASKLPHVRVPGAVDGVGVGALQVDAVFLQKTDREVYGLLLLGAEAVPPTCEFVGEFDLEHHQSVPPR
jgi:hypothetical protein